MGTHRLAVSNLILAVLLATAAVPAAGQQPAPAPPVVIDTRDAPALGPANAPVTIVEFGDFQCPACAQGAKTLRRLVAAYPGRVRWVFKNFPLRTLHPQAALAHEAAMVAHEQGKFWEMHALIFSNQGRIRYDDLVGYAEQIGLDMGAFRDALDTRRLGKRVVRDMDEGRSLLVYATPTYFVNGTRYVGAPDFSRLVNAMLRPSAPVPPGTTATPAEGSGTR